MLFIFHHELIVISISYTGTLTEEQRTKFYKEHAHDLKELGNKFYKANDFGSAVWYYTEAAVIFPNEPGKLFISYILKASCISLLIYLFEVYQSNLSAALYEAASYAMCVDAINKSLAILGDNDPSMISSI